MPLPRPSHINVFLFGIILFILAVAFVAVCRVRSRTRTTATALDAFFAPLFLNQHSLPQTLQEPVTRACTLCATLTELRPSTLGIISPRIPWFERLQRRRLRVAKQRPASANSLLAIDVLTDLFIASVQRTPVVQVGCLSCADD